MAELNDLDNLDFFEDDKVTNQEGEETPTTQPEDDPILENEDEDIISAFLQSKGINPKAVKLQNEDGETEEVDFSTLSKEDQLQILSYNPAEPENTVPELTEDEETLLNILRQNNMSVKDYLNAYKQRVIEQYQADYQPTETFQVDDYNDDELFVANLKDTVPDITEEEAAQELELQKQNPALFKKKMDGLRASYKEREKQAREYEQQVEQAKMEQQAAQFEDLIVKTIENQPSIDLGETSLELSEDDMNDIASFILDSDQAGVRYITKALNDPKTLVEMAWWALKGHDALDQVTQYYKKQIAEARKVAKPAATKPRNVVSKPTNKPNINQEVDLYDNLV